MFLGPASFLLKANYVKTDMTCRRVQNTLLLLTSLHKGDMTRGIVSSLLPVSEVSGRNAQGLTSAGARGWGHRCSSQVLSPDLRSND